MLVLTRKVGEELMINGDIRVSVVRVCGNRVRLGIQCALGRMHPAARLDVDRENTRLQTAGSALLLDRLSGLSAHLQSES